MVVELTQELLESNLDPAYLNRGREYFKDGHVDNLHLPKKGQPITADVIGGGNKPYQVSIVYDKHDIDGDCTCPMQFNCKHVAATLYAAMSELSSLPRKKREKKEEPMPFHNWLGVVGQNTPSIIARDEYASDVRQRLIYILRIDTKNQVHLHFESVRLLKNDEFAKSTPYNIKNILSRNLPRFILSVDEKILREATNTIAASSDAMLLQGVTGCEMLERVLKTGRCFWADKDGGKALKLGKPRQGQWKWLMDAQGMQSLSLQTQPEAVLIRVSPPYYIDTNTHICGEIQQACNLEQTRDLLNLLPISPEDITAKKDIILPQLPKFIPQPERLTLVTQTHTPQPVLKFDSVSIHSSMYGNYFDGLDVWFDYQGEQVRFGDTPEPVRVRQGEQLVEFTRNHDFEKQSMIHVLAQGVTSTPRVQAIHLKKSGILPHFTLSDQDWIIFMANNVPILEDAGFRIEMSQRFRYNLLTAESWELGVDGEGLMGSAEFKANLASGESIDLIDAIASWIKQDPERLSDQMLSTLAHIELVPLPLVDGRMLSIAGDMLHSILKHTMELFTSSSARLSKDVSGIQMLAIKSDLEGREKVRIKDDKRWLDQMQALAGHANTAIITPPKGLMADLRDYQRDGLNWLHMMMQSGVHGILADDMGLGKTIQTLACILKEKEDGRLTKPALVIAPTSLMHNWRMESAKFTPDLKVLVLHGAHRAQYFDTISQYDLVLTTYPLLPRDAGFLLEEEYHMLILDEAQNIKNPRAKASRLVREFTAQHRLCLTGTPIENHLGELWAQFDFLMPGYLFDQKNFNSLFRKPIEIEASDARQAALNLRTRPFMLRRLKEQVAKELPAKTNIVRSIELEGKQRALYESVRLAMQKKVRDSVAAMGAAKSQIIVLDALMKMRQVCCDPRLLKNMDTQNIASAKIAMLRDMVPEMVEEGRKILLFSQFAEMLRIIEGELADLGIAYVKLTGQTKDRVTPVDAFQNGEVPVFLVSLKAGGTGLNLTAADTVIHFDPWWNPAAEDQATDRAYRIGQDKPVFVYKLTTIGTVEEKILAMQERKRELAKSIHGSGSKRSAMWSEAELQSLFEPLAAEEG